MIRSQRISIHSIPARRAVWLVAASRVGRSLGMGILLVSLAQRIGDVSAMSPTHGWTWPAAGIALATVCAYAEVIVGGRQARAEEGHLRRRILQELFARTVTGDKNVGQAGRAVTLLTDNAERACEFRQTYWGATMAALLVPMATALFITISLDAMVGGALLVAYPMVPLLITLFLKAFRARSQDSRRQRGILASRYLDALDNLVLIRMLGAGERVEAELRADGERNRLSIMRLLAGNQVVIIVVDGLFALLLLVMSGVLGGVRVQGGQLSMADAVAVVLLSVLLLEPLEQVAAFFYVGMGGIASSRAIRQWLAGAITITPRANGAGERCSGVRRPVSTMDCAVALDEVCCGYGDERVLRSVTGRIGAGEAVALVGRSGAGKSTLLGVIQGRVVPSSGTAWVDALQVDAAGAADVSQRSAMVAQRTWLFSGTIADNLLIARPDASDRQLWQALEQADVAQDVRAMPHGLDSDVGGQGRALSGGQAQRISLARALLSQRPILLLDEPTAHVDIESERRIIMAISRIHGSRTIVMATHRPELLSLADQTWQVEHGTVTPLQTEQALA